MPMAKKEDTIEKVDATEVETTEVVETEEAKESTSTDEKIDYKAIAEAERIRAEEETIKRLNAEQALAEKRFKSAEQKRREDNEVDEDKPLTLKELREHEARIIERARKEVQENRAIEIIRANTESEDEAQAALMFWKNRIVPTGNLEEDVTFAIAGLNKNKLIARNSELVRALRSKDGVNKDYANTFREPTEGVTPKMAPDLASSLKKAGFTYDTKDKNWKKKLPNGKTLVRDPRTKQTRIL